MSCLRVSDVLDMSHDSVNRFLYRETYSPEDLFAEASKSLGLIGGILLVDDMVLDKPYANVTGDSWYSCVPNLKAAKKHGLGMMFGIEANRLVSVEKGTWLQVQKLDIPEDGLLVWLKDFGYVKVFRTLLRNQKGHYVTSIPEDDNSDDKEKQLLTLHQSI